MSNNLLTAPPKMPTSIRDAVHKFRSWNNRKPGMRGIKEFIRYQLHEFFSEFLPAFAILALLIIGFYIAYAIGGLGRLEHVMSIHEVSFLSGLLCFIAWGGHNKLDAAISILIPWESGTYLLDSDHDMLEQLSLSDKYLTDCYLSTNWAPLRPSRERQYTRLCVTLANLYMRELGGTHCSMTAAELLAEVEALRVAVLSRR